MNNEPLEKRLISSEMTYSASSRGESKGHVSDMPDLERKMISAKRWDEFSCLPHNLHAEGSNKVCSGQNNNSREKFLLDSQEIMVSKREPENTKVGVIITHHLQIKVIR
jgi:hypothetical protein